MSVNASMSARSCQLRSAACGPPACFKCRRIARLANARLYHLSDRHRRKNSAAAMARRMRTGMIAARPATHIYTVARPRDGCCLQR